MLCSPERTWVNKPTLYYSQLVFSNLLRFVKSSRRRMQWIFHVQSKLSNYASLLMYQQNKSAEAAKVSKTRLALEQSRFFVFVVYAQTRKFASLTVKSPKCNLGRTSGITWIPHVASQSVLANHPASSWRKISYSQRPQSQNGVLLNNESVLGRWRVFRKSSEPSRSHIGHPGGVFMGGKYRHCSRGPPTSRNTWRLRWNAHCLESSHFAQ